MEVPTYAAADLEGLIEELDLRGFSLDHSEQGPMSSYVLRFSSPQQVLAIVSDRGQLSVEGDKTLLERFGLWRAFDDRSEFRKAVLRFLNSE